MTTTTFTRQPRPWLPALNLAIAAAAIVLASIALVTATDDDAVTRPATAPTSRVAPANVALEDWEKVPSGPVRDAMREDAVVWEPLTIEGRDFVRDVPAPRAVVDD